MYLFEPFSNVIMPFSDIFFIRIAVAVCSVLYIQYVLFTAYSQNNLHMTVTFPASWFM